jgi:hypothetical protein
VRGVVPPVVHGLRDLMNEVVYESGISPVYAEDEGGHGRPLKCYISARM